MTKTAELTHLFRALKAPAAARALPKLAERAREEEWSHERFLEAVLSTEVSSRESHGGENRIKAARFPARKTLEEFDFTFQRSVKKQVVEHLGPGLSAAQGLSAPACSTSPYRLASAGGISTFRPFCSRRRGWSTFQPAEVVRFSTGVDTGWAGRRRRPRLSVTVSD